MSSLVIHGPHGIISNPRTVLKGDTFSSAACHQNRKQHAQIEKASALTAVVQITVHAAFDINPTGAAFVLNSFLGFDHQ
jgi:hypothetical protein